MNRKLTLTALLALTAICASAQIPYVDYHSALAAEDGSFPRKYSYDGVHPGLAGYKIMEPLLLSILK